MTKEQAKLMLPFIQAFAEGREITFHGQKCKDFTFEGCPQSYEILPLKFPELPEGYEWHFYFNHKQLTPEQIGVQDGYRPLFRGEETHDDDQYLINIYKHEWRKRSSCNNITNKKIEKTFPTHRTKRPLPDFTVKEMTMEEVEKMAGCKVKIIK